MFAVVALVLNMHLRPIRVLCDPRSYAMVYIVRDPAICDSLIARDPSDTVNSDGFASKSGDVRVASRSVEFNALRFNSCVHLGVKPLACGKPPNKIY
jgi:hypothetical protein